SSPTFFKLAPPASRSRCQSLSVNGEELRRGAGSVVMGHPLDALAQYVAERAESGPGMVAGEIVSTGTWTAPYLAQAGDRIVAGFGPRGRVELELAGSHGLGCARLRGGEEGGSNPTGSAGRPPPGVD